jgi:hypothetical protein
MVLVKRLSQSSLDSHAADGPWIRHVLTQRKNMKNNRNQWRRNFRTPSNIDVPRWGTFTDVIRYCTYFLIFLYWNALRQGLNISKWLQFNTNSRRITKNRTWVSCKWERAKSLGVLENRAPTAPSHFLPTKRKIASRHFHHSDRIAREVRLEPSRWCSHSTYC